MSLVFCYIDDEIVEEFPQLAPIFASDDGEDYDGYDEDESGETLVTKVTLVLIVEHGSGLQVVIPYGGDKMYVIEGGDYFDNLSDNDLLPIVSGLQDMQVNARQLQGKFSSRPLAISRLGGKTYVTLLDVTDAQETLQLAYVVETGAISFVSQTDVDTVPTLAFILNALLDLDSEQFPHHSAARDLLYGFFSVPSAHEERHSLVETFTASLSKLLTIVDVRHHFEDTLLTKDARSAMLCRDGVGYKDDETNLAFAEFVTQVTENIVVPIISLIGEKYVA